MKREERAGSGEREFSISVGIQTDWTMVWHDNFWKDSLGREVGEARQEAAGAKAQEMGYRHVPRRRVKPA